MTTIGKNIGTSTTSGVMSHGVGTRGESDAQPDGPHKILGRPVPKNQPEEGMLRLRDPQLPRRPHCSGGRITIPEQFRERIEDLMKRPDLGAPAPSPEPTPDPASTPESSTESAAESGAPEPASTVPTPNGDVDVTYEADVPDGATAPNLAGMTWTSTPGDLFTSSETKVQLNATDADGNEVFAEDAFSMDGEHDGHDNATLVVEADGYEWTYSAEFDNGGAWSSGGSWNPQELVLVDVQPLEG